MSTPNRTDEKMVLLTVQSSKVFLWVGYLAPLFYLFSLASLQLVLGGLLNSSGITGRLALAGLTLSLAVLLALIVTSRLGTARPWTALGLSWPGWRYLLLGVLLGVGLMGLLQGVAYGLAALGAPVESSTTSLNAGSLSGNARLFVLALYLPIVAPLVEELFFRGYMLGFTFQGHGLEDRDTTFSPMRRKIVLTFAAIFSSLLFALLHFQGATTVTDFLVLIWTFSFAIFVSLLRFATRSFWPGVAAHSSYNSLTALSLAF